MSGFEFTLRHRAPVRTAEQRTTFLTLTGTAGPYGEVIVTVGTRPRLATLSCTALPEASISHPDDTQEGLITVDERTRLTVNGHEVSLSQRRGARGKEDRAIRFRLGGRDYSYLSAGTNVEQLRDSARGPLVRIRSSFSAKSTVTVVAEADDTDLAVALVLQGAGTAGLTLTRSAISGVLSFLQAGSGET
jgi:hypothetical protein